MKKIVVILALFFTFFSVSAQTYEELKEKSKEAQCELQKRLDKINSRIFYLEDEVLQIGTDKKGLVYNNRQVKKDQKLRSEELGVLKKQKDNLLEALEKLDEKYYTLTDKQIDVNTDNLPDRMGPVEYKQRGRTQALRLANGTTGTVNKTAEFTGILINSKIGRGEKAYFKILRTDIKENFDRVKIPVDPKDEVQTTLPMGKYVCVVECGSRSYNHYFSVDPRSTTAAGKERKPVYFWIEKTLYD